MKCNRSQILTTIAGGLAVISLVVFSGFQISKLNTRYSIRQYFPKSHPILKQNEEIVKTFELRETAAFFATLEIPAGAKGTWLEPKRMADLKEITEKLSALEDVGSVVSLANVSMAIADKSELHIGPIGDVLPPKKWNAAVTNQQLLEPQLITKDHRTVLVAIEPRTTVNSKLAVLENRIRRTIRSTIIPYHTGLAGVPVMQSRLSEKLKSEVGKFLALCLIIFVAMFALFYRNWAPIAFVSICLIICNFCVLGLLAYLNVPMTMLLSTLPIVVSIACVSLAIHTLHIWADRLSDFNHPTHPVTRWQLNLRTQKEIFRGNFLGSLTTAIGFAALITAAVPAIQQYALVVSGSVILTFTLMEIIFVISLPWQNPVPRKWVGRRANWMLLVTRHAKPVFASVVLLTLFMGYQAFNLNFSTQLFTDLPRKEAVSQDMARIDRGFGGTVNLDIAIDAHNKKVWADPVQLKKLKSALAQIRNVKGVGSVLGLTDFLETPLPVKREAVAETFFMYSMASSNPLRQFVDGAQRKTRIAVRLADLPSDQIEAVRKKVRAIIQTEMPGVHLTEVGLAVNSHTINKEVSHELLFGFWQSILAIGLLLFFIFRSWRFALVACLPNLMAPIMLMGVMALAQTPIKPAVALIFSVAIGLAFNNTVYLLSRLKRLQKTAGSNRAALREALLVEGNPCMAESLLTFGGFLIFVSSDFSLNQTFGAYMVISIFAGFLGDLAFMPAMLHLFPNLLPAPGGAAEAPGLRGVAPATSDLSSLKTAASFAAIMTIAMFASGKAQAGEAEVLLSKSRHALESKTDQASVNLKIIEANGDKKVRSLNLKTLRDKNAFYALVRILAPNDIKGTALLSEIKDGVESQWLYSPSSQQVRRVVSSNKSSGVLGSELTAEDLNSSAIKGAKVKLIKKDAKTAWIEVTPEKGASEYTSVVLMLSLPQALPQQTQYFKGKKKVKTVDFKNYVATKSKVFRAKNLNVKNLVNGRATEVEFKDLKTNAKLDADDFTVNALKRSE